MNEPVFTAVDYVERMIRSRMIPGGRGWTRTELVVDLPADPGHVAEALALLEAEGVVLCEEIDEQEIYRGV